ncbi:MAG: reverse transcriptase family protein [Alphaproteobacteria bacterium]|jgi:retron-type reverse transcriptase|nr:reverse transcriptase family protein [Alphaproteobacteria bacterium]MBU2125269.1 reverse transcriptase family protein [Alphaproteobacteria bacterium]MBU2208253.1 reverse transcriptase family protein [Alphaproteobacteria bacterium]
MASIKAYALRDSPFFRLKSKSKLADILFVSAEKLERLANDPNRYYKFKKPKKTGGEREICAPNPALKAAQKRISQLLSRIAPPDYLFAPVSGRSYVDNAAVHVEAKSLHLLDIDSFFPNCRVEKVAWLFAKKLECSPDVTAILCKIVTYEGCLPQGSPCSPILAYLSYIDMWSEIDACVQAASCKLSVYADDLTISGDLVRGETVWAVKKILYRHGHQYAVDKERSCRGRPAEITGVILHRNEVRVPNRQYHRIYEIRGRLRAASTDEATTLRRQLSGRLAQMAQVRAGNRHKSPQA